MGSKHKIDAFRVVFSGTLIFMVALILGVVLYQAKEVSPGDFSRLLRETQVRSAILRSITAASIASVLAMIVGIPTAYVLSRSNSKAIVVLDAIIDIPIVVSPVALGTAALILLSGSVSDLGIVYAFGGIVFAQFLVVSALAVRLMKATFDGIDLRLEAVARTLGATRWRTFLRVSLPLARHGIIAAVILTWTRALGEFGATVILAGAIPAKTLTIPTAIFLSMSKLDLGMAVLLVFVLVGLSFVAMLSLRLLSRIGRPI